MKVTERGVRIGRAQASCVGAWEFVSQLRQTNDIHKFVLVVSDAGGCGCGDGAVIPVGK